MSEPAQLGNEGRDWRLYVDDMISFAEKVLAYTEGFDQSRFESSGLNYDATVRNLHAVPKMELDEKVSGGFLGEKSSPADHN